MARVLVVDDEPGIRRTIGLFLTGAGHEVETAANADEASKHVTDGEFDVIVSDIMMPGDDGLHLLEFVRARHALTQFILITGEPTVETAAEGMRLGAFDYLPKPAKRKTLCRAVEKAAIEKDLREQNAKLQEQIRRHSEGLERLVEERTSELNATADQLRGAVERLAKTVNSTTLALSMALEILDPYTSGHQRRVTDIACAIWDRLALPSEAREGLRIAGLLHDIGKLAVPAEILCKPTRLSAAEFSLVRNHSVSGWEILKLADFPWPVATIVRQHHERLDGSGYPDGLSGSDILMEACVLCVADVV